MVLFAIKKIKLSFLTYSKEVSHSIPRFRILLNVCQGSLIQMSDLNPKPLPQQSAVTCINNELLYTVYQCKCGPAQAPFFSPAPSSPLKSRLSTIVTGSTFLTTPHPHYYKNSFIFKYLFFNLPLIDVGTRFFFFI